MQTNKKPVGRPPKNVAKAATTEVKQETVGEVTKIVREETDRLTGALKQKRVRRVFNGTKGKLEFGKLPEGYHYHLVNDTPGRVAEKLNQGYEFVKPNEVEFLNVSVTDRNTDLGDKVRILVNPTAPEGQQHAYLMRILQEYYDEDMAVLQKRNDMIDEAVHAAGKSRPDFYSNGGIKMSQSNKF